MNEIRVGLVVPAILGGFVQFAKKYSVRQNRMGRPKEDKRRKGGRKLFHWVSEILDGLVYR